MCGGWVVDFRGSPFALQPSVGVVPVGLQVVLLLPMDKGGFGAPFEEPSHYLPMRSGQHKVLHRRFGCPHSAGPECTITVAEQ